jgi:hypothetical protein
MPKKAPYQAPEPLQRNRVFTVLQHLDAAERKRLLQFMRSAYFVRSKNLAQLCALFLQAIESGREGFEREKVWHQVFPGAPYEDVNFRKLCSDLLRLIERFMAQEMAAQDAIRQAVGTLEFAVRRKVEPLSAIALREARQLLSQTNYRSASAFHAAYLIERQYYAMMDFDVKLSARANLEEISQHLDHFYWIEKLKIFSAALSQQRTGNNRYELRFLEEVVGFLRDYPMGSTPELALHFYSFLTLYEEENVEHYYRLRQLLEQHGAAMPTEEALELYDAALHYCTGKLNKGNREFLQEYFDLFDGAVSKGVLLVGGELASWRFNNVVGVALRLGKLDWAEQFVEAHKDRLPPDTRQNTYAFNLARVYRYRGQYSRVLSLLRDLDYEDIGYSLIGKMMLAITYYELDEQDALRSFLDSFRIFLNRQKNIPGALKQSFLNLLTHIRQLPRLKVGDPTAIARLRAEIERDKAQIANYEWLLEKLDELLQVRA